MTSTYSSFICSLPTYQVRHSGRPHGQVGDATTYVHIVPNRSPLLPCCCYVWLMLQLSFPPSDVPTGLMDMARIPVLTLHQKVHLLRSSNKGDARFQPLSVAKAARSHLHQRKSHLIGSVCRHTSTQTYLICYVCRYTNENKEKQKKEGKEASMAASHTWYTCVTRRGWDSHSLESLFRLPSNCIVVLTTPEVFFLLGYTKTKATARYVSKIHEWGGGSVLICCLPWLFDH